MSFSLQIRSKSSAETARGGVSLGGLRLCPQPGSQHTKLREQVSSCACTPVDGRRHPLAVTQTWPIPWVSDVPTALCTNVLLFLPLGTSVSAVSWARRLPLLKASAVPGASRPPARHIRLCLKHGLHKPCLHRRVLR